MFRQRIYNYSIIAVCILALFLGFGTMYALGLKDPSDKKITILSNVPPSTWLSFFIFVFWALKRKIRFYKSETQLLIVCAVYVTVCGIMGVTSNLLVLINVFISFSVLSLLLKNATSLRKKIYTVVLVYYYSECSLAIVERIFQTNFFTISKDVAFFDGSISAIDAGFRSASFHSHPLQGALMVSTVMSFIIISNQKTFKKMTQLSLGLFALFSFNTRSSIAFWGAMISAYIVHLVLIKKTNVTNKVAGVASVILAIFIGGFLIQQGWGGRLIELSLFDDSSAQVRIDVLSVFKDFSWQHFLLGVPNLEWAQISKQNGIFIMENYWITFIVNWGLPMVALLVYLTYQVLKQHSADYPLSKRIFPLLAFIIISSTNNSMVTGVPALLLLLMCFYSFDKDAFPEYSNF